ncbi:Phenazine biosynthesis PhzC/PhzF protein isoform 2 [Tripterygium wilfordii]|uniref:Phenazine biosynthesis PhzC/PhzF protein isoform 2 n=1 Tax=Tripterygium wilfordii TaxID=458696 RepID=A0A7J7CBQ5_TRIWF|nr:uncharacterized isomerase BH0283-like isoform X1 [Tripterygium wilfordii]KAF5731520.1 Phenazine biosynthesis PhzC/PhzF protein isoform 2 [Tripterygium wilfordii]
MAKKPVKYFVVDAFTDSPFKGNPAAVCLLEDKRDDKWLQAVATEFNFSETCYLTRIAESDDTTSSPKFSLRWFTPATEVNLCGHATLAAAHTLFTSGLVNSSIIEFETLSGILTARRVQEIKKSDVLMQQGEAQEGFLIELDFPVVPDAEFNYAEVASVSEALNGVSIIDIRTTTTSNDLLVVFASGDSVIEFKPQFDKIENCPWGGIMVTGLAPPDSEFDFISRYFCPKYGMNEDPVTGGAHCILAPYWSKKLGKNDLTAYQASPRGGILNIHVNEQNHRVLLLGKAVTVMEGSLLV